MPALPPRPATVLAPQTREVLVLSINPVASVAHLDAQARVLASALAARKYVALAKDYHDEPDELHFPTVQHSFLLLSAATAPDAYPVKLQDPSSLPRLKHCLDLTPVTVRVRVAEKDYDCAQLISADELKNVNKACLERTRARAASQQNKSRRCDSPASSASLDWESYADRYSTSTRPTSRGAVEDEPLLGAWNHYGAAAASPLASSSALPFRAPGESFLDMCDSDDGESDYTTAFDGDDEEHSLIGSTCTSSSLSSSARKKLPGASGGVDLEPFSTLAYEAHLRGTRAPVVDVSYDLSLVDNLEDPAQFHAECAALAKIIDDAELRLGRRTARFSYGASSRATLNEHTHAMLHPETTEWEGLNSRDTDSALHTELDADAHASSFLLMHGERGRRRARVALHVRRLYTELGWRCASAVRLVRAGPRCREVRALREGLCGPFD